MRKLVWVAAAFAFGCNKPAPGPAPAASSSPVLAASAPPSASVAPSVAQAPPKPSSGPRVSKERLAAYGAALTEGRKLGQDKQWKEAVLKFEQAVLARPGDTVALAELGFAYYNAGDDTKARGINVRALATATDPNLRAMILFNQGLVHERAGDKVAAQRHHAASYKLRANDAVKKHLEAVGGVVGPCDGVFPTVEAIRDCLFTHEKDGLGNVEGTPLGFMRKVEHPSLVLHVFKWGPGYELDGLGTHPQLLISKVPKGFRKVSDLGADYEPGAFGLHTEARFTGFADEKIGGRSVVKISWEVAEHKSSLGGLQLHDHLEKNVTLCVLGDEKRETTCLVTVAIEEIDELSYPVEGTGEVEAELAAAKAAEPAYKKVMTATFVIGADGRVSVTETAGKRPHLAPLVAGQRLF